MPPKKKGGSAIDPDDPSMNPEAVVDNYKKYCKLAALQPHPKVLAQLGGDEEQLEVMMKNEQLVVDGEPVLGPHGTRALCTALMGNAPGMSGAVFKMAKNFRFWRMDCGDDGAACLAEILRLGGAELPMAYLELLDCNVGYRGAHALGQSLMCGQNRSLLTLKLDYNSSLGSDGCKALCQGLRTNATLKQLHLCYCGLDEDAGKPLGEVLSYAKTTLQKLHLQGNKMRGGGLSGILSGMDNNNKLEYLSLADNAIAATDEDLEALEQLAGVMQRETSLLSQVDLLHNRIGEKGANTMLAAFNGGELEGSKGPPGKVQMLTVDNSLPDQLFNTLGRLDAGKGGKGKKGKKKK